MAAKKAWRAVLAVFILALAGCGQADEPPRAVTATPAAAASAKTNATMPKLCGATRPAQRDPFPYNRDAARRDRIVDAGRTAGESRGYDGGHASFEGLDAAGLATLIEANFIDPHERHNGAPSSWDILQFLCRHAEVRANGYVIGLDRPDYRTSIDDISAWTVTPALRAEAEEFCVDAEESTFEEHLECFWD